MMNIFVVWFALLGVNEAYKCMDPPEMNWPDRVRICNGEFKHNPGCNDQYTKPYKYDDIESALVADPNLLSFVEDSCKIYSPELPLDHEQCPIDGGDLGKTLGRCEKVCPGNYVNITAVNVEMFDEDIHKTRLTQCYVVRPWEQKVFYMNCTYDQPSFKSKSFKCVPDNFIKRRIAVFCPEFKEHQCQKVDIELPTNCAASRFECVQPKKSKNELVNSFFDSLF
ncbi:uncharacterized protein LOC127725817 [Mytilus californianus]|uniref:uncharacterized protein LOC127725817 n=1 Tax=Mytilus californianus TaxID=6549 RepID=UPI002246E333|nr:uncharacterized protein LOC127725817 [Mytilus californianus]